MAQQRILTGDRPTGPLHLGHYVGSLINRVKLQDEYDQFVMIADAQGLTDNAANPQKIVANVIEVAKDYLAVGIDPKKTTIFIQSQVPELAELTQYYMNLVTLARLERNPTVKSEMKQKGYGADVPAGFLTYPVSQAADITAFAATVVPVGEDQLPVIEQTVEIVRRFNSYYGEVLVEPKGLVGDTKRLPGIDGKAKMSKSLDNGIYLSDEADVVKAKIRQMYTDPSHIRPEDPGNVEGNVVFTYLNSFDTDKVGLSELKAHYQQGGVGDVVVKERLEKVLEGLLAPMRERRAHLKDDEIMAMLEEGSKKARTVAAETLARVKDAMGINYFGS